MIKIKHLWVTFFLSFSPFFLSFFLSLFSLGRRQQFCFYKALVMNPDSHPWSDLSIRKWTKMRKIFLFVCVWDQNDQHRIRNEGICLLILEVKVTLLCSLRWVNSSLCFSFFISERVLKIFTYWFQSISLAQCY